MCLHFFSSLRCPSLNMTSLLLILIFPSALGVTLMPDINEITMPRGSALRLVCNDSGPVEWDFPQVGVPNITLIGDSDYVSELSYNTLFHWHTGFYTCRSSIRPNSDKSIYIFVRDPEHLFVSNTTYEPIIAYRGEDIKIPCKPSSRDVNITLDFPEGDSMVGFEYDPYIGFIKRNAEITDSRIWTCRGTRGEMSKRMDYDVNVLPRSEYAPIPIIEIYNCAGKHHKYISVGECVQLTCVTRAVHGIYFDISWSMVGIRKQDNIEVGETEKRNDYEDVNTHLYSKSLVIPSVQKDNEGTFECQIDDHSGNSQVEKFYLSVSPRSSSYLELSIDFNIVKVRIGRRQAQWVVDVVANPPADLMWYDPYGKSLIPTGGRLKMTNTHNQSKVVLDSVSMRDSGVYMLKADNGFHKKTLNVTLLVEGKTVVHLAALSKFYARGKTYAANCTVSGYPNPNISWYFKNCPEYPTCLPKEQRIKDVKTILLPNLYQQVSQAFFEVVGSGILICSAESILGTYNATAKVFISDIDIERINDGFNVWVTKKGETTGDSTAMECAASKYLFTDIKWKSAQYPDEYLTNREGLTISTNTTQYSVISVLSLTNVTLEDSGDYLCEVSNPLTGEVLQRNVTLLIGKLVPPQFLNNRSETSMFHAKLGDMIFFNCSNFGVPIPVVTWYKDGKLLTLSKNESRLVFSKDKEVLKISFAAQQDEGSYSCIVKNKGGYVKAHFNLQIKSNDWISYYVLAGVLIFLMIAIPILYFTQRWILMKKIKRKLVAYGLDNFEEGQVESINPDLDIGEQADLLPYDKKWEFPREKLKLGKQLGSGAFGVVMKADAYGLSDDGKPTIVAVKMVKKNSDFLLTKALASELKIMAHLGQHLNVVNLIGACTRNIYNRELLVIVEYCHFGNLHDYLLKHRKVFFNQIDEETKKIDYSRRNSIPNSLYNCGSLSDGKSTPVSPQTSAYTNGGGTSAATATTTLYSPVDEDGYLMRREYALDVGGAYIGDYKRNQVKTIYTEDLLCWCYQVAKGMEYLASRKVLHGDLAARNILLSENNIVKISDFGLSKSMYKDDNYLQKGNKPLPVKWMALESIRDRIFSTQSDVWAYGIVLWEIFSLSKIPYPGMQVDPSFLKELERGYRMDKPPFAPKDLYNLMLECWREEPMLRPTFTECSERVGSLLQESVKQHYIDLTNAYLKSQSCFEDYLKMFQPPTYENLSSAQPEVGSPTAVEGYLEMRGSSHDAKDSMELKPMLTPGARNVFNPGYEMFHSGGAH